MDTWYFPGTTFLKGNGTGRLYMGEAANEQQRRELKAIIQEKKGGPAVVIFLDC